MFVVLEAAGPSNSLPRATPKDKIPVLLRLWLLLGGTDHLAHILRRAHKIPKIFIAIVLEKFEMSMGSMKMQSAQQRTTQQMP